jgi:hypothetical protein
MVNNFIDELKSLRMVGYKTWHANFEEIKDWELNV